MLISGTADGGADNGADSSIIASKTMDVDGVLNPVSSCKGTAFDLVVLSAFFENVVVSVNAGLVLRRDNFPRCGDDDEAAVDVEVELLEYDDINPCCSGVGKSALNVVEFGTLVLGVSKAGVSDLDRE